MTNDESQLPLTGAARLKEVLRGIARTAQVAAALGIQDPDSQPEEFWVAQRRAARRRLQQLCLQELGWDESLDVEEMDEGQCERVADVAASFLATPGFDYALVRRWFHARGQFQFNKALALARERRYLRDTCLRVLVVLDAGGAKYLAFGPGVDEARLVAEDQAAEFEVTSSIELTKDHRGELAKHFDYLKERIGAKEIKVLQGAKFVR
ncbi:hypothetical protein D3C71_24370 [compost metagenome]